MFTASEIVRTIEMAKYPVLYIGCMEAIKDPKFEQPICMIKFIGLCVYGHSYSMVRLGECRASAVYFPNDVKSEQLHIQRQASRVI